MDKNKAAAAFPELIATLRDVLRQHDPSGLFALGCPEDEHDDDIHRILSLLQGAQGRGDVVNVLDSVLSGWVPEEERKATFEAMAPAVWAAWSAFLENS